MDCPLLGNTLSLSADLQTSYMNATLREVHEGIRELYTCDLCGFTHHRPEGLLDHKNKAHSTKYQVNKNS